MKVVVFFSALLVSLSSMAMEPKAIVEQFVKGFNEKNLTMMLEHAAPNIRWMSLQDNQLTMETDSKTRLQAAMQGYFQSMPSAQSDIVEIFSNKNFVSTVEKANWVSDGVVKSQCSVAVYELKNHQIVNVWYYPARPC